MLIQRQRVCATASSCVFTEIGQVVTYLLLTERSPFIVGLKDTAEGRIEEGLLSSGSAARIAHRAPLSELMMHFLNVNII
jgi:hypothetical protein